MRVIILLSCFILCIQCARQTQPNGGPKDIDPPELISSTPANGEKNFKGKTIELIFDEFVKLKDPKEEILIAPSFGSNTKFLVKKNKVTIIPENDWQDSTTYNVAFREGIQDINESNPAEDLHLAFSTGPTIDSLKLFGTISEVFSHKVPEKITVALYQADTFDIFKHRPTLTSKSDKTGKFTMSNLKAGKYYIYAFDDKNKNQKVDSKSERFGFKANAITLPKDKDSIRIELVHLDSRTPRLTSVRNTNTVSIIRFNKPVNNVSVTTKDTPIVYTFGDNKSELIVYKEFDKKDSVKITIQANDSLEQKLDTTSYIKYTDNKIVNEKFKQTEWQVNYDHTTGKLRAETNLNKRILSLNYDSIYIQLDTINFQNITPQEVTTDTLNKKVTISTILKINPKEKKPNPIILFGRGALVSVDNDSSKAKDIKIKIPKPENTGTVSVEIETSQKHFEVILTTSDNKFVSSFRDLKKYTFSFLNPAEYRISVIIDENNNMKWDPGNFYRKEEPEKVILYKTLENKYTFPIRANWELGPLTIKF